jgi:hypothetical protein
VTTKVDTPAGAPPQRTRGPELLPFGWERDPSVPDLDERETLFRFPAAGDPTPGTARVLAMSLYAALLGLGGVGVGLCAFVSVLGGSAPGWYVPVLALIGLIGVGFAVGAFLSVHRRFLSWGLLLAAAIPLTGDIMIAASF